ncbi:MAG: hypothetical protein LBP69_09515 [Treponema sp.]|jgi:hypothetical protein|nr:hypothetical protein [Treponema sp.]
MKNLAEMAAGICEACRRDIEQETIYAYPVKEIMWAFENRSQGKPMFWGSYEYKGKIYGIEITVKEYKK